MSSDRHYPPIGPLVRMPPELHALVLHYRWLNEQYHDEQDKHAIARAADERTIMSVRFLTVIADRGEIVRQIVKMVDEVFPR